MKGDNRIGAGSDMPEHDEALRIARLVVDSPTEYAVIGELLATALIAYHVEGVRLRKGLEEMWSDLVRLRTTQGESFNELCRRIDALLEGKVVERG